MKENKHLILLTTTLHLNKNRDQKGQYGCIVRNR